MFFRDQHRTTGEPSQRGDAIKTTATLMILDSMHQATSFDLHLDQNAAHDLKSSVSLF